MINLTSFLKDAFQPGPHAGATAPIQCTRLPEIKFTENAQKKFDEYNLDFLCGLYFSTKQQGNLKEKSELWFLEEIAYYLRIVYPNRSRRDYLNILYQVIKMADPNYNCEG